MKVMFDLDPKSLKKLEMLANLKQLSIGELAGELMQRVLNRDPSHGSGLHPTGSSSGLHPTTGSSSGLHPTGSASGSSASGLHPAMAAPPKPPVDDAPLLMVLEPLIARFRLADVDGNQRKSLISELQMMLPDPTASKIIALIQRSFG
jgi:hypothetical protein